MLVMASKAHSFSSFREKFKIDKFDSIIDSYTIFYNRQIFYKHLCIFRKRNSAGYFS